MNKLFIIAGISVVLSVILAIAGLYFYANPESIPYKETQKYSGPIDKVTVGKQVEYGTLFVIAKEQGFFTKNGLDVTIKEYESGAPAFQDLLSGKIEMTNAAEFVGVRNSFSGEDFKILGSIGTATRAWEIVARRDHGIAEISDLKGRRIGVPRRTLGEFFLGNFLILNNISQSEIQLVDSAPQVLFDAILSGSIDAAMIFEPYVFDIKQNLGASAVSFSGQSDRLNYIVLYASGEFVRSKPFVAQRFIQSLVEAEKYIENNEGVVEKFMREELQYSDAYIASVLPEFRFYVSLEQPMLLLMEDEAKWVIENNLTSATVVPNYLNFIYFDALSAVNPTSVTIVR